MIPRVFFKALELQQQSISHTISNELDGGAVQDIDDSMVGW